MRTKYKKYIYTAVALVVWLLIWEILARAVNVDYIFPTFTQTLTSFLGLLIKPSFYLTVMLSILRILLGFIIGSIFGIAAFVYAIMK